MKTFHEAFSDKIDATNGTVVINEDYYNRIVKEGMERAANICREQPEFNFTTDCQHAILTEAEQLTLEII